MNCNEYDQFEDVIQEIDNETTRQCVVCGESLDQSHDTSDPYCSDECYSDDPVEEPEIDDEVPYLCTKCGATVSGPDDDTCQACFDHERINS